MEDGDSDYILGASSLIRLYVTGEGFLVIIIRLTGRAKSYFGDPESASPEVREALPHIWGVLDHMRVSWHSAPRHGSARFVQWINLPAGKVIGIVMSVGERDPVRRLDTITIHDFTVI